ncbi:MAG: DUF115 domain-containing protein [Gammaproteobacteria bacterium]|nr:DUF115 domain-containing protein [Gammaproteobacteria bacterium]
MSNIPPVLEELYLKNLKYFKEKNPNIYEVMTKVTPDNCKITISDNGEVDLIYKGRHIYGGNAIKYVEDEVQEFNQINTAGVRRMAFQLPYPDLYTVPRFFQRHLKETVTAMYNEANEPLSNTLKHEGHYDLLVVMGIGLGLHISEVLDRLDVQNLLVLETDFEFISLSCFFTDWEDIYEIQSPTKGKSITIIAVNNNDPEVEQGSLWNELIKRAPHFPYNTVFYNHGRHKKYGDIIKKISEDQKMFLSLWGYWDDEVSQLNNITYNLEKIIQPNSLLIPARNTFKWDKPVIICGSGPSLDKRIDQLRSIRDKCILISAGTSLLPLLRNGFKPDFHMEMESDYSVYYSLANIEDKSILKDIVLITGIQSTPSITNMFKSAHFFVKDSSATGGLFEKQEDKLRDPTPTCVNAAYSFALHYNADEVFLFGTDFGFYEKKENHSKDSIYNIKNEYTKKINQRNNRNINNSFQSQGYFGDCFTTNIYFTTKRRIELSTKVKRYYHQFNLNNCSDGLIIDGSNRVDADTAINIEIFNEYDTLENFMSASRKIDINVKKVIHDRVIESIHDLANSIIPALKSMKCTTLETSKICWSISDFISAAFHKKYGDLNYFIRGSIWHYLLTGYSISYAVNPAVRENVIDIWRHRFINLLEQMPERLNDVINRERNSEDPSLRSTIRDELDGF